MYSGKKLAATFYNRGLRYFDVKEYQSAIEEFDAAIELNPDEPKFFADRAVAKCFLSQFSEALADVDQALLLSPRDLVLQGIRALIVFRQQNLVDGSEN